METTKRRGPTMAIVVLLMLLGWAASTHAMDAFVAPPDDNADSVDAPKKRPPVSIRLDGYLEQLEQSAARSRVSGWGGPMVGYLGLQLDALEPMTEDRRVPMFGSDQIPIGGIGGVAYYPKGSDGWLYMGGMGFGVPSQEVTRTVNARTRKAEMSMVAGGVFIEYHHQVAPKMDVSIGTMIGAGSMTLRAKGDDLGIIDDDDWSHTQAFFVGSPYLGTSFDIFRWMRLEFTAGYMFMTPDLHADGFTIDDSDLDMTDGAINGGPQAMVRLAFGWRPEKN